MVANARCAVPAGSRNGIADLSRAERFPLHPKGIKAIRHECRGQPRGDERDGEKQGFSYELRLRIRERATAYRGE